MLFTSLSFYLFVVPVLIGLYLMPWHWGRWLLIVASYCFYGAIEPWYCLLLLSSTLVDFFVAQRIEASQLATVRKRWLMVSLLVNLGLLAIFKYADFGINNLNTVLAWFNLSPIDNWHLLLPVGISFYTFQTLSYTIDVYRGKQTATRNFASFALYVGFFPQLVAGPIERAKNLLSQFERGPQPTRADIEYGVQRILWGITKKVVFADRLAVAVNQVYANPASYSSPELLLATLCFSFQLYLDFSAYTDIAIGLARLMGIRLSENFNYPFLARNPSDFWSRWHMTLTNWFRDYLYRALGGTRRSQPMVTAAALLTVMGLMGLWHGAAWNFIAFGLIAGLVMVVYMGLRLWLARGRQYWLTPSWWSTPITILFGSCFIHFIMIFFRSEDLPQAWTVITGIISGSWSIRESLYIPFLVLAFVWSAHIVFGSMKKRFHDWQLPPAIRGTLWALLLLMINYGAIDVTERFIYFQF